MLLSASAIPDKASDKASCILSNRRQLDSVRNALSSNAPGGLQVCCCCYYDNVVTYHACTLMQCIRCTVQPFAAGCTTLHAVPPATVACPDDASAA
jgi:hypothetical protein